MIKRSDIIKCLGKFPKKCKLDVKIIKSIEKPKYIIKEISYNVESNERIKALLLIPKNIIKKTPGILALHQHALQYNLGKSESAGIKGNKMYAYGLELCLKGYIVLCPDHFCFEDRQDTKLKRGDFERFCFTKYLLEGSTLQAKYISDLVCALNVIKSYSKVDKKNIGVIGHSLGGQETLWLMWYDKSIKCGVPSCGFTKIKDIVDKKIIHSFSTYIPNFFKYGDIDDIVSFVAPRAFLMISGENDEIFPINAVKEIEVKANKSYLKIKSQNNFKALYFKGNHSFPKQMRQKAYEWFDLHLK